MASDSGIAFPADFCYNTCDLRHTVCVRPPNEEDLLNRQYLSIYLSNQGSIVRFCMSELDFDRAYLDSMYGRDRRNRTLEGLFGDHSNGYPLQNSHPITFDGRSHLPGEADNEFEAYDTGLSVVISPEDHIFRGAASVIATEAAPAGVPDVEWGTSVDPGATADLAAQTMAATVEVTPVVTGDGNEAAESEAAAA